MDKTKIAPKKPKIFSVKNFIEKEAEEEIELVKKDSNSNKLNIVSLKDTQYSSEVNNPEDDSYGISSDNDTEKIEKQIITNRALLNKEKMEKEKSKKIKRKIKPILEKKDNKKRVMKHIENNAKKVDKVLGIINGKLNICFEENRENKDINVDNNKTPEKKIEAKDDQDLLLIKMSNERKKISNVNKRNNESFIKRIKDNENFIKKNNIIISEEGKRSKSLIVKKKSEEIVAHPKLKLYNLKGVFLNKKKK